MVKRSKRGSIDDLAYILVTLLGAAMLILLFGKFSSEFYTQVNAMDEVPTKGKTAVGQIDNLYGTVIDNSFLFLTIGLCIAAIIMAFLVVIHPVFFVFYFIILSFVIFVGGVASNIYQEAAAHPELTAIADKLLWTSHILNYLPIVIGIFGFILAMVMYKTWQNYS